MSHHQWRLLLLGAGTFLASNIAVWLLYAAYLYFTGRI